MPLLAMSRLLPLPARAGCQGAISQSVSGWILSGLGSGFRAILCRVGVVGMGDGERIGGSIFWPCGGQCDDGIICVVDVQCFESLCFVLQTWNRASCQETMASVRVYLVLLSM